MHKKRFSMEDVNGSFIEEALCVELAEETYKIKKVPQDSTTRQ